MIFVHQICLAVCKSQIQKNFRGNWNFYQFQFKWWNFFLLKSDEEDKKKPLFDPNLFLLLKDAFCHVLATLSCYMYSPCHQCKTFPKYFFLGFHFLIFSKKVEEKSIEKLIQPIYWYHSAMFVLPGFKRDLSLLYHLEAHVLPPVLVKCKNSSKGSYNLQPGTVYNTRNLMSHLTHSSLISVCIFFIHFFKVLIRRICSTIKSFFRWWSFPLFSWP